MTELAVVQHNALALSSDQDYWTDHQIAALRHMGVENASGGDLAVFHHVCQRTGLDPFARQISMIGRNTKDQRTNQWVTKYTIQTGIDGYRLVARRASDRLGETLEYEDTLWCGRDGQWVEVWTSAAPPAAAKVTVLRHGKRFPGIAAYGEYVQTTKNGDPNHIWSRMPSNQLAKCAEALALRKAFPQDLSGVYTDDEMGQADRVERQEPASATAPAVDRMRAMLTVEQIPEQTASLGDPLPDVPESAYPADAVVLPEPVTPAQVKRIAATMGELGITERDNALLYVSDVIGREVASRNELTKDEASRVIESLERDLAQPFPETADGEARS